MPRLGDNMKSNRIRCVLSFLSNVTVVLLTAWSVLCYFTGDRTGDANMAVIGAQCFRYFTIDSNILVSICSIFVLVFTIPGMFRDRVMVPAWAACFKFIGTVSVTLTLLTVLFYLGPMIGYHELFVGNNLFLHLINPLLCLVSFLFFEIGDEIPRHQRWLGIIPVILYEGLYLIMVVSIGAEGGGWKDFYEFNKGNRWYVFVFVMSASVYIVSIILHGIRNEICNKTIEKIYNL